MESSTVPQTEKREYKNQTNGWLGVVVIDAKGEEKGVSIEPLGTIWLSDAEATLTSRAPRLAADNPFEEQTFIGLNEAGARQEFLMRPLVLASDDSRYVPTQDRYVPPPATTGAEAAMQAEAGAKDPASAATSPQAAAREAAILASPPSQGAVTGATPLPAHVAVAGPPSTGSQALQETPAPPSDDAELGIEEHKEPLFKEAPAPGQVLSGSLRGSDGPAPDVVAAQAADPTALPALASSQVPQTPVPPAPPTAPPFTAEEAATQLAPPAEEHAVAVDPAIGEETGRAKPPAGAPVEGEFAAAEEVGSPDAPQASPESATEGS